MPATQRGARPQLPPRGCRTGPTRAPPVRVLWQARRPAAPVREVRVVQSRPAPVAPTTRSGCTPRVRCRQGTKAEGKGPAAATDLPRPEARTVVSCRAPVRPRQEMPRREVPRPGVLRREAARRGGSASRLRPVGRTGPGARRPRDRKARSPQRVCPLGKAPSDGQTNG